MRGIILKLGLISENGSEIVSAFCTASPREPQFAAHADRVNSIAQCTVSSAPSLGVPHMRHCARHHVEADLRIQTKLHDRDLVFVRGDTSNATSTTRTLPALQCAKRVICSASGRTIVTRRIKIITVSYARHLERDGVTR